MKMLFLCICLSVPPLFSQTVVLTNTANSALDDYPSADFVEGDTLSLQIRGAAHNAAVTLVSTINGSADPNNPWYAGMTDGNGDFTINATVTPGCCVSVRTEQWYVGGAAVGTELDFETIYKPSNLVVTSTSVASEPSDCTALGFIYAVHADIGFQVKDSGGHNVTFQTAIALQPTEFVTFYNPNGTSRGSKSGYPTADLLTDDGKFHDSPWGDCANQTVGQFKIFDQILYIEIGNNSPTVRTQSAYFSSSGANHGTVANTSNGTGDINVSR